MKSYNYFRDQRNTSRDLEIQEVLGGNFVILWKSRVDRIDQMWLRRYKSLEKIVSFLIFFNYHMNQK